jgi:predicted nucleic acid-binding Zn ribbon protein
MERSIATTNAEYRLMHQRQMRHTENIWQEKGGRKMSNADRCVCCGEIIPEGTMACPNCLVVSKKQDKRLIDANALRKQMFSYYSCVDENSRKEYYRGETLMSYEVADLIEDCIDDAPTVDAVEVVHGRWIKKKLVMCEPYYLCSVCGKLHDQDYNFCNNCGAKMDGERKDNG